MAESDGTVVESITRLPEDPPTEAQLAYAADLHIRVPPNATKWEVRDLISCRVDRDEPSSERHRLFSQMYRVECTQYIGKKELFDWILNKLREPGREQEMSEWFTYRAYRELVGGADDAPIQGPDNSTIKEIASELSKDPSVVASIRRYEGRDLVWFGQYTSPNGSVYEGGSNRTVAYKRANTLLHERLGLATRTRGRQQNSPQAQGCMVSILMLAATLVVVAWVLR